MATPSKDPRTGIYQFRRVVPEALRPHFDGGRTEYKRSLDTRDPEEAKKLYPAQAQIFEQKLAAARRALLTKHLAAATGMVDAFLEGVDDDALRGMAMKLASLETGAFGSAHGIDPDSPGARYDFGNPPSRADLDDHAARKQMLEAVSDLQPLPWLETLQRVAALPSLDPIDWAIASIAYNAKVEAEPGSELHEAIGRAYLDRLCAACAVRVAPTRTRIIPAPVIVNGASPPPVVAVSVAPPAVPAPTLTTAYEAWVNFKPRELKLVDEWRRAIQRFVALNGDLPVDQITATMVRDYRRTCSGLPSRASKEIALLPVREQVEFARSHNLRTLASDTVNKALSAIRVTLSHAVEELEVIADNVAKGVKSLPRDDIEDARLPFDPADLQRIYSAELPKKEGVSTQTLFWVLLLAPFTGCRLDELGSLRPGNVRRYEGIDYIAIEVDRRRVREQQDAPKKRIKTASAKRDIPIHPLLIEAGFLDLVERRREEKAAWLFPELQANKYGSRTQRLSRVINDFLDDIGLSDPELVFHSFRHTGKRAIRGKVQTDIVDLLFGHADGSVSTKYGRGAEMQTLHDAIAKLVYPEVDWKAFIAGAPVSI
ncbi:DUF6538 domain-containing protein [Sphingomonas sp. ac-8]|uniref:DUF6538 domain-containing protein n=1 Tax=Sphingomonas sp. ac-8 TaxID=3242977 RepID=UPI003A7FAE9C